MKKKTFDIKNANRPLSKRAQKRAKLIRRCIGCGADIHIHEGSTRVQCPRCLEN